MTTPAAPPKPPGLFDSLRSAALSSIPIVSAFVFVIVAVKVFRASGMETTTTVAIVTKADQVALLKGVILTLLPGFLAAVTAVALWWWAEAFPDDDLTDRGVAIRLLLSPRGWFAWAMVAMAFFTISWPIFLLLFAPTAYASIELLRTLGRKRGREVHAHAARWVLKGVGTGAAVIAIGFLTLTPSVWLPLRTITVAPRHHVMLNGHALPHRFAAYILDQSDAAVSLLLAKPRGVIQVVPDEIEPDAPLCITPESPTRFLDLRASQVLGIDQDNHSPYEHCPKLDYQTIFGN